ncbi:12729_t:CDS:2 [Acaulospora colombiana]|uniref:12729_t:CDS:1 n=1 Tax=Acaulospora colombiana TaxID=27376 RepID=A0ACA9PQ53_9GLOM|nr:12729_t:CDS:2 [Acaulospora colombiana]
MPIRSTGQVATNMTEAFPHLCMSWAIILVLEVGAQVVLLETFIEPLSMVGDDLDLNLQATRLDEVCSSIEMFLYRYSPQNAEVWLSYHISSKRMASLSRAFKLGRAKCKIRVITRLQPGP